MQARVLWTLAGAVGGGRPACGREAESRVGMSWHLSPHPSVCTALTCRPLRLEMPRRGLCPVSGRCARWAAGTGCRFVLDRHVCFRH